jgi:hypothetical protein
MKSADRKSAYKKKYILYAITPSCNSLMEPHPLVLFFQIKAYPAIMIEIH